MTSKKKTVKKKKRAGKYEKKLIVNASFNEVLKISTLPMPDKK